MPVRFGFVAAEPVHESVPFFASLLRTRGHTVSVLDDGRRLLTDAGRTHYDLVWYRFSPGRDRRLPELAWEALLAYEAVGIPVVNSSESLLLARNKFLATVCFQHVGLDQPATQLLCEDEPGFPPPYIIKPIFGSLSQGIAIVASHREAIAHGLRHGPCIIQGYLEDSVVIRVIAGPERALLIREKRLDSNRAYAPPRQPTQRDIEVSGLAQSMVRAVKGDLMGVDILLHQGGLLALEVNGGFGFSPDWEAGGSIIADEFERIAEQQRRLRSCE